MSFCYAEGETLGRAMFGRAELGDRRRTARLVETFDRMRRHPGGTLPDKLASPPNLKALYRLCRQGTNDSRRADSGDAKLYGAQRRRA